MSGCAVASCLLVLWSCVWSRQQVQKQVAIVSRVSEKLNQFQQETSAAASERRTRRLELRRQQEELKKLLRIKQREKARVVLVKQQLHT